MLVGNWLGPCGGRALSRGGGLAAGRAPLTMEVQGRASRSRSGIGNEESLGDSDGDGGSTWCEACSANEAPGTIAKPRRPRYLKLKRQPPTHAIDTSQNRLRARGCAHAFVVGVPMGMPQYTQLHFSIHFYAAWLLNDRLHLSLSAHIDRHHTQHAGTGAGTRHGHARKAVRRAHEAEEREPSDPTGSRRRALLVL